MSRRWLICLVILSLALAAAACREARMAAPEEVVGIISAWKVEQTRFTGWDGPFSFGPYRVDHIRRGWSERTAWGFMSYESYRADQSYEFQVHGPGGQAWHCNCASQVNQQVLECMLGGGKLTWELGAGQSLACSLKGPGGQLWRLGLAAAGASKSPMQGLLEGKELAVRVQGTDKLEGTGIPLGEPTGYIFSLAGSKTGPMGAVQVINNGILWLPTSPQQPALAATSAALLLYQDLSRKP